MSVKFDRDNLESITIELEGMSEAYSLLYRAVKAEDDNPQLLREFLEATSALHTYFDRIVYELREMVDDSEAE